MTVTVYVNPTTGVDNPTHGTFGLPYKTLGYALTNGGVNPGGTVLLMQGTYPITTQIAISSYTNVTIAAYLSQVPTIDGGGSAIAALSLTACTALTIKGITFQNGDSILSLTTCKNCIIEGNTFQNGDAMLSLTTCTGCTIEGNTFQSSATGSTIGASEIKQCQGISIINNVFNNCYNGVNFIFSSWCTVSGNTINNSTLCGFLGTGGSNNNTIANNLIDTVTVSGGGVGGAGVYLAGGSGNLITHNQIQNCGGAAVVINALNASSFCFGITVSYNYCPINCTSVSGTIHCGVIYASNGALMLNNALVIDNNYVSIPPAASMTSTILTTGIALDNFSSGCTVTNNIIVQGQAGILIRGGMNNIVQNNIIDMNTLDATFNYAGIYAGESGFTGGSMSNNVVTANIVYSVAIAAPTAWVTQTSGVVTVNRNFYWNGNNGQTPVSGIDPHPLIDNPEFADYPNGVYGLYSTSLCIIDGFACVNQRLIGLSP